MFGDRCREGLEFIKRMKKPLIVNHYDCDGICSGSLVKKGLLKLGVGCENRTLRNLGEDELKDLKDEKELIFVDFGGARTDLIEEILPDSEVLVIDHHQAKDGKILQVNPFLFGIDGGNELSASGTAYFVFNDTSFADLGVVGSVGDMQDPFVGWNKRLTDEGVNAGEITREYDLRLFGRVSRPLVQFLTYCTEPYLPGITGSEEKARVFISDLGIEMKAGNEWRRYGELNRDEKKLFVGGLVKHLYSRGRGRSAEELVGEVYGLVNRPVGTELSDAKEFSTLINACGRQGRPDIGIGVCVGESGAYKEASALLLKHRRALREGIEYSSKAVEDYGRFYFLDGRGIIDDGIIGVVAGMLYGVIRRDKPIVAIAFYSDGHIKISGRATARLVKEGVNLSELLHAATEGIGLGGGHNIAAGGKLEQDKVNEFLLQLDRELKG
ncbi:MAG: DHH family phosphoesterase [Candidatus Micrarchaeota archaeon]